MVYNLRVTNRSNSPLAGYDWRKSFLDADRLPQNATPAQKATRGRQFEKILAAMFEDAGLRPRLNYRPKGEEIDGSVWLQGRTILIEAKWTQDPHPASSLYQFRGKVDGKLAGTVGLFISMAGFSKDAVDALVAGKELNLILADGEDLRAVAEGKFTIVEALERKLRAAGDAGTPFLPLGSTAVEHLGTRRSVVFVEGRFDARVLEILRRSLGGSPNVAIIPAGGPSNIAPLIEEFSSVMDGFEKLTVIIDGDYPSSRVHTELEESFATMAAEYAGTIVAELVVLEPDLDSAFGLVQPGAGWEERRGLRRLSDRRLEGRLLSTDVTRRAQSNPAVAKVLDAIGIEIGQ